MNFVFMRRAALVAGTLACAFALDFATKWLILNVVMAPPRNIELTPFFSLALGFNTGVSFGILRESFLERPLMLVGIAMVIVTGLLVWAMRAAKQLEAVSLGLIAGGALGNAVDRIRQGAVTDFLDFHLAGWRWPTFNVADILIAIGVTLLITASFWPAERRVRQ